MMHIHIMEINSAIDDAFYQNCMFLSDKQFLNF